MKQTQFNSAPNRLPFLFFFACALSLLFVGEGCSKKTDPRDEETVYLFPKKDAEPSASAGGQDTARSQGAQTGSASGAPTGSIRAGGAIPGGSVPTMGATSPEAAQAPAAPTCFMATFRQKNPGSSESGRNHRNQIRLTVEGAINTKALCVRVDGTPVHFEVKSSNVTEKASDLSLVIGPVAGANSRITARYCLGKSTCNEGCAVPAEKKDEFMAAIAGSDADEALAKGKNAKWDPSEGEAENDVTAELDEEVKRELAGASDLEIFDGWSSEPAAAACGAKSASANKPGKTPASG